METTTWKYQPGDKIEYVAFGGETRTVTVTWRTDDIKNGEPGFDGYEGDAPREDGFGVWGYDYQITRIVEVAR